MSGLLEVSKALGFAPQHLFSVVATRDHQYRKAQIPKRNPGAGFRVIDIPTSGLKGIQRQINYVYLSREKVDDAAFAYVRQRGVVQAAKRLSGGKAVLKIDLQDFFPSISEGRVFGMFRSFGLDAAASSILTDLCTFGGHLPQGAPTSPSISNIIIRSLDEILFREASKWELSYTRYCDDLFFSHERNFNHPDFLEHCCKIIEAAGFLVNAEKTRYYPRGVPRRTLGLLTHGDRLALPGPVRRKLRAAFHKASRNIGWGQENLSKLRGQLEWYKSVYGKDLKYFEYKSVLDTLNKIKLHISYQSV